MSHIDSTQLNDLLAVGAENEKRFNRHGIIKAVKNATAGVDYISPSNKEKLATMSGSRDLQLPVIKDQKVTVTTSPSFTIPSNLAESVNYSFVPYNVFSGFRYYPAAFENNQLDAEEYKRNVMLNVLEGMADEVEGILAARLEDRKTQVLNHTIQVSQGDGTYTFDAATDKLNISKAAQKETMFFNLDTLMGANKLAGPYAVVTNPGGLSVQKAEQLKFSVANQQNKSALGMFPMDRMHESDLIDAVGNNIFDGWLIRDGAMGVIENYPVDFRKGTILGEKKWTVSDTELPFLNMRANVFTNADATNATSVITPNTDSNLEMTYFEEMAIWARFYVVYRYNSDLTTRPQDIVKLSGLPT